MTTLWNYVDDLVYGHKSLADEDKEEFEKNYTPYIVNRHLSYFIDTVMFANEMNLRRGISKRQHYGYLMNSIRPRKRFTKWVKKEKDNVLEIIQEYFNCNPTRAKEYLQVLSEDQIEIIKKSKGMNNE